MSETGDDGPLTLPDRTYGAQGKSPGMHAPVDACAHHVDACAHLLFTTNSAREPPKILCLGKLPKLPIPSLEGTCKLLLEILKPLISDAEYATAQNDVEIFLEGKG